MNDLELVGTLSELLADVADFVIQMYRDNGDEVRLATLAAEDVDILDATADAASFVLILLMRELMDDQ